MTPRIHGSMDWTRLRQRRPRLELNPKEYRIIRKQVLERDGWRPEVRLHGKPRGPSHEAQEPPR